MFRRIVLSSPTDTSGTISLVYYVKSARFIGQSRLVTGSLYTSISNPGVSAPVIFSNAVKLSTVSVVGKNRYHVFDFDVGENQPIAESVEEISSTGVGIAVYNVNGVLVCDNGVANMPSSDPTQSDETQSAPGEMTSVPGTEPGEMTAAPSPAPGAMI